MQEADELAAVLDQAFCAALPVPQISQSKLLTIEDAYCIQHSLIARRLFRGERLIGVKMGFTSQAKMVQMGVFDQILGRLTNAMQIHNGEAISFDRFIHPRCEPEIAFLLKNDLGEIVSLGEAANAIDAIAPAIEIIDSRYQQFEFSLADVIADNASSACFVLGDWEQFSRDMPALDVQMLVNGEVSLCGSTADILGNPLLALISAARLAATSGWPLKAGDIVLAGAATPAITIAKGMQVLVSIAGLGDVRLSVSP